MNMLEKRSEVILEAVITEYMATGEPVGSRTISKRKGIQLSAASIRNIMSDLTEMGYISQPHISAGRVPTDVAYRFYVDSLLRTQNLLPEEESEIEADLKSAGFDVKDVLRKSSSVLAEFSRQAGVTATVLTTADSRTFKTVEFLKISDDRILVILVSTSGSVQSKIIPDEESISQDVLEKYGRMLTDMLKDLDLHQARRRIEVELAHERALFDQVMAKTLKLCHLMLSSDESREIFIDGRTNIIDEPEFAHIEKLKAILTTFEEKTRLLKLLDCTLQAEGIQILIGSEHGIEEMESCSVVAYPIRTGGKVIGSISVIGPKRMNYRKVVPLVDSTARIMTRLIKRVIETIV